MVAVDRRHPRQAERGHRDDRAARDRGLKAGELVRSASEVLGGRGGGKDDIAQGGGTDAGRIDDALKAVEHAIGHALQA